MAIPVNGPQELFVWGEHVEAASCQTVVLILQIIDPMQLPLGAELIAHPKPLISESLYSLKNPVMEQVRKVPF